MAKYQIAWVFEKQHGFTPSVMETPEDLVNFVIRTRKTDRCYFLVDVSEVSQSRIDDLPENFRFRIWWIDPETKFLQRGVGVHRSFSEAVVSRAILDKYHNIDRDIEYRIELFDLTETFQVSAGDATKEPDNLPISVNLSKTTIEFLEQIGPEFGETDYNKIIVLLCLFYHLTKK